ncbi:sugar-binding transcriptional regulator [Sporolactobacillus spathodeae]|uniref:DNA-binding transcriptional regulator LsrR (DeoR family) n=1 Tax=Sporolactobacillus spathodeae TaxID=1465502 RepID=A0ABS2Q598_9BACL|nr:sugar-binding transcriptional regulator [Sporolactobacillus spathodeae]MBM7656866.1 DNA-binding transcriptional regulator LsrR (DeoR family) [Sporolactobacillus spathodeae]
MVKSNNRELLVKIAQMYYLENMTQSQIANALGIYRTTISRLLKRVRDEGIVTITINYGSNRETELEKSLCERFGLKEAIVVSTWNLPHNQVEKSQVMGKAAASFLKRITGDGDVIGFSWGSSLAAVAEQLDPDERKNVLCVPMIGGASGRLKSRFHVNTICYQVAEKFRGDSLLADFPAVFESEAIKQAMIQTKHFREIESVWERLSIALFGIGSVILQGTENWQAFYGSGTVHSLVDRQAAGDILSSFYDAWGIPVETDLSARTMALPLERLKQLPYSIGIAESSAKVPAIIGALRGNYMNVLVTTDETAREILEADA